VNAAGASPPEATAATVHSTSPAAGQTRDNSERRAVKRDAAQSASSGDGAMVADVHAREQRPRTRADVRTLEQAHAEVARLGEELQASGEQVEQFRRQLAREEQKLRESQGVAGALTRQRDEAEMDAVSDAVNATADTAQTAEDAGLLYKTDKLAWTEAQARVNEELQARALSAYQERDGALQVAREARLKLNEASHALLAEKHAAEQAANHAIEANRKYVAEKAAMEAAVVQETGVRAELRVAESAAAAAQDGESRARAAVAASAGAQRVAAQQRKETLGRAETAEAYNRRLEQNAAAVRGDVARYEAEKAKFVEGARTEEAAVVDLRGRMGAAEAEAEAARRALVVYKEEARIQTENFQATTAGTELEVGRLRALLRSTEESVDAKREELAEYARRAGVFQDARELQVSQSHARDRTLDELRESLKRAESDAAQNLAQAASDATNWGEMRDQAFLEHQRVVSQVEALSEESATATAQIAHLSGERDAALGARARAAAQRPGGFAKKAHLRSALGRRGAPRQAEAALASGVPGAGSRAEAGGASMDTGTQLHAEAGGSSMDTGTHGVGGALARLSQERRTTATMVEREVEAKRAVVQVREEIRKEKARGKAALAALAAASKAPSRKRRATEEEVEPGHAATAIGVSGSGSGFGGFGRTPSTAEASAATSSAWTPPPGSLADIFTQHAGQAPASPHVEGPLESNLPVPASSHPASPGQSSSLSALSSSPSSPDQAHPVAAFPSHASIPAASVLPPQLPQTVAEATEGVDAAVAMPGVDTDERSDAALSDAERDAGMTVRDEGAGGGSPGTQRRTRDPERRPRGERSPRNKSRSRERRARHKPPGTGSPRSSS
jgi:hypothetical protein